MVVHAVTYTLSFSQLPWDPSPITGEVSLEAENNTRLAAIPVCRKIPTSHLAL
jgi:hypothetical protein